jgi:hypothetical protein
MVPGWILAFCDQSYTFSYPRRLVEVEQGSGCASCGRNGHEKRAVQSEVVGPALDAGMEELYDEARVWVKRS